MGVGSAGRKSVLGVELRTLIKLVWLEEETQDHCAVHATGLMPVARWPPDVVTG